MTDMVRGAALSVSEFAELSILAKATIVVVLMLLAVRVARRARAHQSATYC